VNPAIRTFPIKTVCLLAVAVMLNGCGRRKPEPAPPSAAQQGSAVSLETLANNSPAANPPPPAPGQEPSEAAAVAETVNTTGDTVDPNLRAILVKFYNEQLHPAQSWDELLAGKYITKIPIGPDGKPLDWNKTMQSIGRARNPVQ
jgi:hypothetical protein